LSEGKSSSKLRLANGERRPKLKPRGISKLRMLDPSIPDPLLPHRIKPGTTLNPGGRSKKTRLSEAVASTLEELHPKHPDFTRAEVIADKLLTRAENDSTELERVLRITEPELAGNLNSGVGLSVQTEDVSVVFSRLLSTE
jgi:hypothetical protein